MDRIAIAVVGAGAIGRAHAELIARTPGCLLAGIADPATPAADLAARLAAPYFADHRAMLDAVEIDAAIVATPNATHLPVALDFIERGVPVIVEKPIAHTVEDARALTRAAQAAGVPVLVGHHRRHNPIIGMARQMIDEGRLGRLTSANILYTFQKPPEYFDLGWRRKPGGGPILINLIHEIDLVRYVCGEIAAVQAVASNAVRGFEVEDTAAVILRLVNGALVTLALSDTAAAPWSWDLVARESANYPPQPVPLNTHFISGTDGSLTLPQLEFWRYKSQKGWFHPISREMVQIEHADPYRRQLEHLCRVARGEEAPLISAADGTRTLAATLAVLAAARSGHTIELTDD